MLGALWKLILSFLLSLVYEALRGDFFRGVIMTKTKLAKIGVESGLKLRDLRVSDSSKLNLDLDIDAVDGSFLDNCSKCR